MSNEPEEFDSNKIDDDHFEKYLTGESGMSRDYEALGADGPPQELDRRILAEAERVAKVRVFSFGAMSSRWLDPPVAIAATLLLSFSLVMSIMTFVPSDMENGIESGRRDSKARQNESVEADIDDGPAFAEEAARPQPERGEDMKLVVTSRAVKKEFVAPMAPATVSESLDSESLSLTRSKNIGQEPIATGETSSIIEIIREGLLEEWREPAQDGVAAEEIELSADLAVAIQPTLETPRAAAAAKKSETDSAQARLQEILWLYDDHQEEAAAQAIAEFRFAYPDHPVSVLLSERGY